MVFLFEHASGLLNNDATNSYTDQMIANLVSRTSLPVDSTVYNIKRLNHKAPYFEGYPQGDYLKQICLVLSLWRSSGKFPIQFKSLESLQSFDTTEDVLEQLNKLTPQVEALFQEID